MREKKRVIAYVPDQETGSTGDLLAINNQDDAHPARKLPVVIFRDALTNNKCELAEHNFREFNKKPGQSQIQGLHSNDNLN